MSKLGQARAKGFVGDLGGAGYSATVKAIGQLEQLVTKLNGIRDRLEGYGPFYDKAPVASLVRELQETAGLVKSWARVLWYSDNIERSRLSKIRSDLNRAVPALMEAAETTGRDAPQVSFRLMEPISILDTALWTADRGLMKSSPGVTPTGDPTWAEPMNRSQDVSYESPDRNTVTDHEVKKEGMSLGTILLLGVAGALGFYIVSDR